MPSEISIQGRTTHWSSYKVQTVKFQLDSFNDHGRAVYAGYERKMKRVWRHPEFGSQGRGKYEYQFLDDESDDRKMIYLIYD